MSYLKTSIAFLFPIMLLSAGSILVNPFHKDAEKTSVTSSAKEVTSTILETPVVKADDGNACRCYYEITVDEGFTHFISFKRKLSSSGTWTTTTWNNTTNHIFGSFDVSAPYGYDFGITTSQPSSGNAIVACCNRPSVSYSGSLSNIIIATNYTTSGCDIYCDPSF